MRFYILDGKESVEELDILKWAEWFESADLEVARTELGNVLVSTVFLGVDRSYGEPPILFETMVFGGEMDRASRRYATWEEAEEGHKEVVANVQTSGEGLV